MNRGSGIWGKGTAAVVEPEYLASLIAAAADMSIVIAADGVIQSIMVNAGETAYGDLEHWVGRSVTDFLTVDSVPKLKAVLDEFASGTFNARAVELNHRDNAAWAFPVRYSFHPFGNDGSIIMLGRDLRAIAETQQQLVAAQMSLEQGYEARREFDARYRLLLRSVRDAVVFVSVATGKIKDLNEPAAALLGRGRDALIDATFATEFKDRRSEELVESLVNTAISENKAAFDVESKRGRDRIMITPNVFRAGGERVLICRLESEQDAQQHQDELAANLGILFDKGTDAIVFTSASGIIQTCNDAFLDMIDAAHLVDVKGRSLGDFMGRGQIDMSVVIENARRAGQMRLYSTKVLNEYGSKTPVEMSVTVIDGQPEAEMGFVIRDASRVDAFRKAPMSGSDDNSRNVMELVGSATLKEIVSETTDVVEKMCIETAVTLTRNNRVAAAEMLGLSRQSLYVKLRKYGLLNKDFDGED